jgi:hypothetical protein
MAGGSEERTDSSTLRGGMLLTAADSGDAEAVIRLTHTTLAGIDDCCCTLGGMSLGSLAQRVREGRHYVVVPRECFIPSTLHALVKSLVADLPTESDRYLFIDLFRRVEAVYRHMWYEDFRGLKQSFALFSPHNEVRVCVCDVFDSIIVVVVLLSAFVLRFSLDHSFSCSSLIGLSPSCSQLFLSLTCLGHAHITLSRRPLFSALLFSD